MLLEVGAKIQGRHHEGFKSEVMAQIDSVSLGTRLFDTIHRLCDI
jgi:hypothetical protein